MAVDVERVGRVEMDVVLVINQKDEYHVSHFSMDFAVNKIPRATCLLAVGVDVQTQKPATIHRTAYSVLTMLPAEVFFTPKNDSQWRPQGPNWPEGKTRIFKGYVTGFGTAKVRGSMRAVVNMIHWLADLNFSSCLSNMTHPCNPNQFSWRACYPGDGQQTGADQQPSFNVDMISRDAFTADKIGRDLWSSLHEMFHGMSERDLMKFVPGNQALQGKGKSNPRAKRALKFIETQASVAAKADVSEWWKPLSLKMDDGTTKQIADAIATVISQESLTSYISTTFWDKLINDLAPNFMFVVVPRIETAIMAPFIPGLRETFTKQLKADEMSHLEFDAVLNKPLRAVSIISGFEFMTNWTSPTDPDVFSSLAAGGCWSPSQIDDDGLILTKPAPPWLTNVPVHTQDASVTVLSTERQARPHACSSDKARPEGDIGKGDASGDTPAKVAKKCQGILTRLAHTVFIEEVLRGRMGVVVGKLRFDIAPGSTVYVENTREIHLGDADLLGSEDFVADVVRVTCEMDAEAAQARTSFQLAHVRTKTENKDDRYSVEEHPLYQQKYTGAPLLDKYVFKDAANA